METLVQSRSDKSQRLFTKNTGLCEHEVDVRTTPAQCRKVGRVARTEAPVNGGRNYNGPR